MRLFVAIELSDAAQRHLAGVQDLLRPQVHSASWTKQPNLHLTLKFLGEVAEPRVPDICQSLQAVSPVGSFALRASGLTCFPPNGAVRIIAAAFAGDQDPLRALFGSLEAECTKLGFAREKRDYHAHATLARPRAVLAPAVRPRLLSLSAPAWPGPEFTVREFVLMESRLQQEGAEYIPAARFSIAR